MTRIKSFLTAFVVFAIATLTLIALDFGTRLMNMPNTVEMVLGMAAILAVVFGDFLLGAMLVYLWRE